MNTCDLARANEIFEDTVRLDKDMFAVTDLYLFAAYRINERQFGQLAVEKVRQRFENLTEGRFANEHRVEHAVLRVGIGVLTNTAAGERTVTDIHRKQQVVHRLFAIYRQDHVLRLMLDDGGDETEHIVHMVTADIIFERLGFLAAHRVHTKTDGVDEVPMMLDVIAPVGDATDIYRMSFAFEEPPQTLLMVLGQVPVPTPIVTGVSVSPQESMPSPVSAVSLAQNTQRTQPV